MKLRASSRTRTVLMIASLAILFGCSDDDPAPTQPTVPSSGVFLDAAVQGLSYSSGAKSGVTDATGKFEYEAGQPVAFEVGDIALGSAASGAAVITPIQLVIGAFDETDPTVTNLSRFLLTIDDDADASNGILITDAVRQAATGSLDFAQTITEFESDPEVLATVNTLTTETEAGARTLVSANEAQAHLAGTLLGTRAGHYSGVLAEQHEGGPLQMSSSGSPAGVLHDLGTWTFTVDAKGVIDGTMTIGTNHYPIQSTVGTDGEFVGGEKLPAAFTFTGTIGVDGGVDGHWFGPDKVHGLLDGQKDTPQPARI